MPKYIDKMCAKYDERWTEQHRSGSVKSVFSPAFKGSRLGEGKIVEYPVRGALGALQWAATTCRPDITTPVSALARYTCKPVTTQLVAAIRTVLRRSPKYKMSSFNGVILPSDRAGRSPKYNGTVIGVSQNKQLAAAG